MIQLQDRDRKLISLSFDHQFLPGRDAQRFVFKGTIPRRARERIAELVEAGYIRREPVFTLGNSSIIRLTKKGMELAQTQRPYEIPYRRRLDPVTLVHDGFTISTRLRLEELWDATWVPEGALKAEQFPQIPDGVLVFPNGSQVAVEIENSVKGISRFHQIQERWRKIPIKLVLYVATHAALFKILQRYLSEGPRDLPFGLVLWSELDQSVPKIWTAMGELDLFSRRTF